MAYGTEIVVPIEISHSYLRIKTYDSQENEEGQRLALNLINEVRVEALAKMVEYQKKASFYYNLQIKERFYREGDLVLRKLEVSAVGQKGKLSPNSEGSYRIKKVK